MKVVIADDHPVVLMGVKSLLKRHAESIDIVGEAQSGSELLALLAKQACDLLITDFSMPDQRGVTDGLFLLRRLQRDYPHLPVIVLTMVHNPTLIRGMASSGVRGIVDKSALTVDLLLAVQAVTAGRSYIKEQPLASNPAASAEGAAPRAVLSTREAEVVRLFAHGLTVTQIAEQIHRSVKTVSQQKNDAMRKLGLVSNSQLYEYAKAYGLVS